MLQFEQPDDFVIATGESHTVREFCELAFDEVGLNYRDYVVVDERFYRPAEVESLIGDSSKGRRALNWQPCYTFAELVKVMFVLLKVPLSVTVLMTDQLVWSTFVADSIL